MRTARSRDANDGAYNSLAEGQTKTFNFAYDVVDEHGASVRQTAAVMITGTNDAPEVVVNSPATVNEGDAGVSAPITVIISDHVTISTRIQPTHGCLMRAGSPSSAPPILRRRAASPRCSRSILRRARSAMTARPSITWPPARASPPRSLSTAARARTCCRSKLH